MEVRKCPRKEDENKKGEKIEVVFKENDYIQSVMIKYFIFLDFFFFKKCPSYFLQNCLSCKPAI